MFKTILTQIFYSIYNNVRPSSIKNKVKTTQFHIPVLFSETEVNCSPIKNKPSVGLILVTLFTTKGILE